VDWPQDAAFRRFTDEIATWWPLRTHSIGQERAESVVFEGRVGGRIVERIRGGEESTWGTVTAWEPPHRVAFTWHPGQPVEKAQDIEVRFTAEGSRTRLQLTHSGWERLGEKAARARKAYGPGWTYVLALWAGRRYSPIVLFMDAMLAVVGPFLRRRFEKEQAAEKARAAAST
jgi:uncharacterized protein YndB with AHSA1/START domain